jgi:tripartite ATP-independent transporter DctP family solute receptor
VQIFPNAQMGNERDTAQAVRQGSLEMGAIGVGLMNWVPEMSITDAPFLWKSRQQCWNAINGAFGDDLRKRSLEKGFVLSGWTDLGFRSITNNKLAINSAKDMQGLKMRVPNSKAYIQMIQAMGATTVAVDLSELYLALRQGVADGQDTPAVVVKSNKFYEVQKYIAKTEHVLTTAYTVTNPKFYDALTAEEKTAFNSACKNANEFLRAYTVKDESEAYDFLKAQGMQVNLTPDVESFRVATASVIEKNPDLFVPELVKLARATPA